MKIDFLNILETKYLSDLRGWRNQDFVRQNMITQDWISQEEHDRYILALKAGLNLFCFVALVNGQPRGIITLRISHEDSVITPGMYMIHQHDFGSGYAVAMSFARSEACFRVMPNAVIRSIVLQRNSKSLRLNMSMGFEVVGQGQVEVGPARLEETVILELTKDMWIARKPKIERLIRFIPIESIGSLPIKLNHGVGL